MRVLIKVRVGNTVIIYTGESAFMNLHYLNVSMLMSEN